MVYNHRAGVLIPFVQKYYKLLILAVAGLFIASSAAMLTSANAAKPQSLSYDCSTLKDGTIEYGRPTDPTEDIIPLGVDQWGYNYQAHMFNGYYDNSSRPNVPVEDGSWLQMKWNDAWLSNKDCVTQFGFDADQSPAVAGPDGKLDRHLGYENYRGSGAWLTNHEVGKNDDGTTWTYFVKIVAAPTDATLVGGVWYNADGTELGQEIWGQFAITQEVYNDPMADSHGVQYHSPFGPGFGHINN